jgi:hypothetical protein
MDDERAHRPKPARKNPVRTIAGMWGAAAGSSANDAPDHDAPGYDDPGDGSDGSFVDQGVRAAYTVVDAYLRQGRRVARSLGQYSLPLMTNRWRSRGRQARLIRLTSELTANWFELLGLLTESLVPLFDPGVEPDQTDERAAPPESPRAAPATVGASSVGVSYDIASSRPVLVRLEFHSGKATSRITCLGLRSPGAGHPPIAATFAARHEHEVVVTIRVPEHQPPGLYTDVVLDARTGGIVGHISLELR